MRLRFLRFIFIVFASALVGYYVGVNKVNFEWNNYKPNLSIINREPPASLATVDFSLFWNVWQKLENTYYDKKAIDSQKLLDGAISGMVQGLGDPYTVYLPPKENTNFRESMAGQFSGIGAELGMKDKQIVVVAPLDGSPAEKSGIKPGDAILKVDHQSTAGWTLSQAVEKIRGPKGTIVILTILHKNSVEKAEEMKIARDTITIKSVAGWIKKAKDIETVKLTGNKEKTNLEKNIVYLRLSQFGDNTNQEWLTLVNKISLEISKSGNVVGLILDLRNNPGGYLSDATFIASEFIRSGTVVLQEKGNGEKTNFNVSRKGLLTDLPVIVLINKGSASASEIVAGAIRDHKRGKLVGETSFGKGTIQQAEDLGDGAGLHVTIAKWLTPNGIWVHGKGLEPDIAVALDQKDQSRDFQLERAIEELIK